MKSSNDNNTKKKKIKQIDMKEHIKKRSMWAGSKSNQVQEVYLLSEYEDQYSGEKHKIFKSEEVKYPPALYKIIDEIAVNSVDHYVNNMKEVTEIKFNLYDDGSISVYNNGPGIHIEETKNIQGVTMYTPQLIFSEFLAGSNLDDIEETERIVGGQNGLGAKITAVFSDYLTIETLDTISKIKYTQTFRNGLDIVEAPELIKIKKKSESYTCIRFLPTYNEFKLNIDTIHKTLYKLIEARAWQVAAYTGIKVYFNDVLIPLKSFTQFCSMFTENIYSTTMTGDNLYPWEICIGLTDGKEKQISMVNGVFINSGGTHIKHIQNHIVTNIKPKIEKELKRSKTTFNKNILLNGIFIFMKGSIPNPEFLSQTKDAISNAISKFESYSINPNEWTKIWKFIEPSIMASFLKRQLGNEKIRANRGKVDVPKYREANYCRNSKKCHECGLIITEGDSASGTAETGLLSKASPNFNFDWFGVYGIQGVMVNGLKESVEYKKESTKKTKKKLEEKSNKINKENPKKKLEETPNKIDRIPGKKVRDNERLNSLIKILGLDYNKTYELNTQGEKEWNTLRYGFIAGLTDQDLDGFNIFGLLVTYLLTYWPALAGRNFIRRIYTPLLRAYPKNRKQKVKEFYTEKQAKDWVDEIGEEYVHNNYNFKYYKGLGSHKESFKEVTQMFKNIDNKICTYFLDDNGIMNMFIYYGPDTGPRKDALRTPVTQELISGIKLPISQQFIVDTKLYQRDNIIRKLINAMDGFVDCRRKIFFTLRKIGRKEIKVQGLAGEVVARANYHHGETSLEQSIVRMAHAYPEARELPLLLPLGNFGSRPKGYKDNAASRYIYTMINWRLADKLFRKEDEFILPYTVVDGQRFEPDNYVPVIPHSLCISEEMPGTGWTICTHARDINDVIKNTRDMIKGKIKKCGKLKMNMDKFNGRLQKYNGKTYFVGSYEYDEKENVITITSLPPNKWSYYYLEGSDADTIGKKEKREDGIKHREYVADCYDYTTMNEVKIVIYLKDNAIEEIEKKYGCENFDAVEHYFELKTAIHDRINLVNEKGEVIEYSKYEDVFDTWFEYRKTLYGLRVEREKILVLLEIKMLKEQQRFSRTHDEYNITNKTSEEKAISILHTNKYKIFNKTLLLNPKFTEVKELVNIATKEEYGANYDYLLTLSYKDLTENAYKKRESRIKELEHRNKYLEDDEDSLFVGSKIWLHELEECEKSIIEGKKSNWFYGENEYIFDDDVDLNKNNKKKKVKGKK